MIVISDSVMPTVATASAPRRPTKKMSATSEHRLHEHLEHHRDREQHDGAADGRLGVVLVGAANGFADGFPDRRFGR